MNEINLLDTIPIPRLDLYNYQQMMQLMRQLADDHLLGLCQVSSGNQCSYHCGDYELSGPPDLTGYSQIGINPNVIIYFQRNRGDASESRPSPTVGMIRDQNHRDVPITVEDIFKTLALDRDPQGTKEIIAHLLGQAMLTQKISDTIPPSADYLQRQAQAILPDIDSNIRFLRKVLAKPYNTDAYISDYRGFGFLSHKLLYASGALGLTAMACGSTSALTEPRYSGPAIPIPANSNPSGCMCGDVLEKGGCEGEGGEFIEATDYDISWCGGRLSPDQPNPVQPELPGDEPVEPEDDLEFQLFHTQNLSDIASLYRSDRLRDECVYNMIRLFANAAGLDIFLDPPDDFSGMIIFDDQQTATFIDTFIADPYNWAGFKSVGNPQFKGDCACHGASLINWVFSEAGLFFKPDQVSHTPGGRYIPIPGIPDEFEATIFVYTNGTRKDVWYANKTGRKIVIKYHVHQGQIDFYLAGNH